MSEEGRGEKRKPVIIKEVLEDFFKDYKQPQETPQSVILKNWEEIISKAAARDAAPVVIKNKILIIAVSNSALLHYLTLKKKEICEKIEQFLGNKAVKDIRFKISNIE